MILLHFGVEVSVMYTNWKNNTRVRRILPLRLEKKDTEWHGPDKWILVSIDLEDMKVKDFLLDGIKGNAC
jgi:hypothetical protein